MRGLGIDAETPVVIAHNGSNATDFGAAARVYWTLKRLEVSDLAILNGGVGVWQAAGLPLSAEPAMVAASDYAPEFDERWLKTRSDAGRLVTSGPARLLDARPTDFFLGRLWHAAARMPGHVPGADNLTHDSWFVDGGPILREPEELALIARDRGLDRTAAVVSFCNTGHWAATNWFVLSEIVGIEGVTLYPESMVEWSQVGLLDRLDAAGAVALTLVALVAVSAAFAARATPGARLPDRRLVLAAVLLALLATLNLIVAGQPWGVVYGLGQWGARIADAAAFDISATVFWANPVNAERLRESILTDVTSLTNLGIIGGALISARWKGPMAPQIAPLPARVWLAATIAALAMGYSARLAFGCNVGAFFSGITSGSLHGWVWFPAALAGTAVGVRLRPMLGLEAGARP